MRKRRSYIPSLATTPVQKTRFSPQKDPRAKCHAYSQGSASNPCPKALLEALANNADSHMPKALRTAQFLQRLLSKSPA